MTVVEGSAHGFGAFTIGNPGRAALELADGPPTAPVGRGDVELTAVSLDRLGLRAASVRGVSHREDGEPRQDAFALAHNRRPEDGLVAVVCDGVGLYAETIFPSSRSRCSADRGTRQ